jgi:hypothetical protein
MKCLDKKSGKKIYVIELDEDELNTIISLVMRCPIRQSYEYAQSGGIKTIDSIQILTQLEEMAGII